jgi:hypothetical protein
MKKPYYLFLILKGTDVMLTNNILSYIKKIFEPPRFLTLTAQIGFVRGHFDLTDYKDYKIQTVLNFNNSEWIVIKWKSKK